MLGVLFCIYHYKVEKKLSYPPFAQETTYKLRALHMPCFCLRYITHAKELEVRPYRHKT